MYELLISAVLKLKEQEALGIAGRLKIDLNVFECRRSIILLIHVSQITLWIYNISVNLKKKNGDSEGRLTETLTATLGIMDLQMHTGSNPDQLWSCWQIRTEEPISLNPGLHW